jgi:hypothetical protein
MALSFLFLMTRRLVGMLPGRSQSERANDLKVARRDQARTSCRGPVVLVNQAAKTLPASDAGRSPANMRHGSAVDHRWRRELKASVWPLVVVVPHVLVEDPRKLASTQDQQPVQTLGPHRPDPPLGDRVGVWRLDRRGDDLDPVGGEDVVKAARELAVTVTNEEPRPTGTFSVHRELACSLDHPGPVRMVGDAGESNSPVWGSMSNKTERVLRHTVATVKQVGGHDGRGLRAKQCSPGGGRPSRCWPKSIA